MGARPSCTASHLPLSEPAVVQGQVNQPVGASVSSSEKQLRKVSEKRVLFVERLVSTGDRAAFAKSLSTRAGLLKSLPMVLPGLL